MLNLSPQSILIWYIYQVHFPIAPFLRHRRNRYYCVMGVCVQSTDHKHHNFPFHSTTFSLCCCTCPPTSPAPPFTYLSAPWHLKYTQKLTSNNNSQKIDFFCVPKQKILCVVFLKLFSYAFIFHIKNIIF
jgi:hypothetical protein